LDHDEVFGWAAGLVAFLTAATAAAEAKNRATPRPQIADRFAPGFFAVETNGAKRLHRLIGEALHFLRILALDAQEPGRVCTRG
jgi:hypothetical protein